MSDPDARYHIASQLPTIDPTPEPTPEPEAPAAHETTPEPEPEAPQPPAEP
jgi:hypothetical protein